MTAMASQINADFFLESLDSAGIFLEKAGISCSAPSQSLRKLESIIRLQNRDGDFLDGMKKFLRSPNAIQNVTLLEVVAFYQANLNTDYIFKL